MQSDWILRQEWRDLLYVHWEVDPDELRARIPAPLKLDLHEGKAYLGQVGLDMRSGHLPFLSGVSLYRPFSEINLRTYVRYKNKRGAYFFSLKAPHLLTVCLARAVYKLPYVWSNVRKIHQGHQLGYTAESSITSDQDIRHPEENQALDKWLTHVLRSFQVAGDGRVVEARLWHPKLSFRPAKITDEGREMAESLGVTLEGKPFGLFCPRATAHVWAPRYV